MEWNPLYYQEALPQGGIRFQSTWQPVVPVPGFSWFYIRAFFLDDCSILNDSAYVCMNLAFDLDHNFPAGTEFRLALRKSNADFLSIHASPSTIQGSPIVDESASV
jgi:hypothetical protein